MVQTSGFVLASASPRRHRILSQLGLEFDVVPSDIDEMRENGESPEAYAKRISDCKVTEVARRYCSAHPGCFVLGADTIVVIDQDVLGKPDDEMAAQTMLQLLSGRTHQVMTAVTLQTADATYRDRLLVKTDVLFRELDSETISGYISSGEGLDKAGAYAIQGLGMGLVLDINGSYSNVVGLPASQTLCMLINCGLVRKWP